MTTHITVRMAWHDSGWNGHICQNPKANVYCVGRHSFPNEIIPNERNLEWEQKHKGIAANALGNLLPCAWSINAFGRETIKAYSRPPIWFKDGTSLKQWDIPPATIAIWPYEEVYKDEVKNPEGNGPVWDPVKRREEVSNFFNQITGGKSLIFYYANYSNPFSEGDSQKYVVIGVSRVLSVGDEIVWDDQSSRMEGRYGPNVWARNITSTYPEEGFRIPYHRYMDNPEILERLLFVPEDARLFKYATRHLTDDDALGVIERFIAVVDVLIEIRDDSEDWQTRRDWLTSLMAELWQSRGLYPGLLRVMQYLGFQEAIDYAKKRFDANSTEEQAVKDDLFAVIDSKKDLLPGLEVSKPLLTKIRQRWERLGNEARSLLKDVLIRFDLKNDQFAFIIDEASKVNVTATPQDIIANPYILAEQYIGRDADDKISFNRIDRGAFPSPDLGASLSFEVDAWQRLRALAVQELRSASQHTYLPLHQVVISINEGLSHLPERRQFKFKLQDFEINRRDLEFALQFRQRDGITYAYLKNHYEDERLVEETLRDLALRTQVKQRNPVSPGFWKNALKEAKSPLNQIGADLYEEILSAQAEVCQRVFPRALTVVCGAAGTGKTTIINAIIKSIENAHGASAVFKLLAPTGKAADRLRERTNKEAQTIHSFLTNGWLNTHNMTFNRSGKPETRFTTYIVDEASMLDVPLLATFFRAVNWNSVQRLILVGDPNQLPPIGTGRVFADLVDWLSEDFPEHVGQLAINVRQIVNRIEGHGTGIVDVASTYTRQNTPGVKSAKEEAIREQVLEKLWRGHDLDGDLRIEYWDSPEELEQLLMTIVVEDMERFSKTRFDPGKPYELWNAAMRDSDGNVDAHAIQILSPYRGELFGIEHINTIIQQHKNAASIKSLGQIGGITSFDKVIQIRNQKREAWDRNLRQKTKEYVYNGEIGFADLQTNKGGRFLNTTFKRNKQLVFGYSSNSDVLENLELAYAISVHKSQGSEFEHVYFIVPRSKRTLLSRELFYTGLTRARQKCTLLVEGDITTLLALQRPESSHLSYINASLFSFDPVPDVYLELQKQRMQPDYIDGSISDISIVDQLCRYRSDSQIARLLIEQGIPFDYQVPIKDDTKGVFLLPTFTVKLRGDDYYWEHMGLIEDEDTAAFWDKKLRNYELLGLEKQLVVSKEHELTNSYLDEKLSELFSLA